MGTPVFAAARTTPRTQDPKLSNDYDTRACAHERGGVCALRALLGHRAAATNQISIGRIKSEGEEGAQDPQEAAVREKAGA